MSSKAAVSTTEDHIRKQCYSNFQSIYSSSYPEIFEIILFILFCTISFTATIKSSTLKFSYNFQILNHLRLFCIKDSSLRRRNKVVSQMSPRSTFKNQIDVNDLVKTSKNNMRSLSHRSNVLSSFK